MASERKHVSDYDNASHISNIRDGKWFRANSKPLSPRSIHERDDFEGRAPAHISTNAPLRTPPTASQDLVAEMAALMAARMPLARPVMPVDPHMAMPLRNTRCKPTAMHGWAPKGERFVEPKRKNLGDVQRDRVKARPHAVKWAVKDTSYARLDTAIGYCEAAGPAYTVGQEATTGAYKVFRAYCLPTGWTQVFPLN